MLKVENTEVFGFEAAIRGMRNPMNSWEQTDSYNDIAYFYDSQGCYMHDQHFVIGQNDLKLMKNLAKAGSDHAKYLRMINVTMDVTAPLYWWKEADTYAVGVVKNSCSTMHKIHDKEFTLDDFSTEHLSVSNDDVNPFIQGCDPVVPMGIMDIVIKELNWARRKYFEAKKKPMKEEAKRAELVKHYWWQMIQLLPSSYNQRRTVQLNYEVLRNQYHARKNHKLDCWHTYCDWIKTLPYAKELIIGEE